MSEQQQNDQQPEQEQVPDSELTIHTPPADTEGTQGLIATEAPEQQEG